MDTIEKLRVLADDSRYDLACACGTNNDDRRRRGKDGKWLYPVALPSGGYSVLLTREPGGTVISEQIRKVLLSKKNGAIRRETEALLFSAARAQIVAELIRPALAAGKIVV